ncbi:MAG: class I SAM-dependent methyltransferase [Pseudomonadales bacterium]
MKPFVSAGELVFFFSRFLSRPGKVAAICPSSRYLTRSMFRDLDVGADDVVLELGPGTGSFTREISTLHQRGVRTTYLGIERDEDMARYLSARFPSLEFATGDIVDVRRICRERSLPPATVVICGVPLLLMEESVLSTVLTDIRDCMSDDAVFRAFSYVHCYPTRRASLLRALVQHSFRRGFGISSVLRNLPPAVVLTGEKAR